MIDNIQYKFAENQELAMLANSFIERYINGNENPAEMETNMASFGSDVKFSI